MKTLKNNWHKLALIIILLLGGFLYFYAVGSEDFANEYYATAIKSMLTSWHNFFYASFDPGGYVTVDKPAFGLWLQALSALIFGFSGWSLILPEALSAMVSVGLLYHLVQRSFGKTAGIASALVLALTPILTAVSRTNNLDSSLVMVLLLAAWALIAAAEKGNLPLLCLSMLLVGIGFNIKMLEAYMVLPAFYLVYMITAHASIKKRILNLAAATAVLLAVSLSWALAVDMTPASMRPYVGSSRSNSVIDLALNYNGIQRITGNRLFSMPDDRTATDGSQTAADKSARAGTAMIQTADGNKVSAGTDAAREGENGQRGVFRVFNRQIAGQVSWLLPFASFGIIILSARSLKREEKNRENILRHLILWSAWIIPMLAYFSVSAFFHRYYLSMLAPGIAALAGIGIVEMWKAYMESGWKWVLLPASFIITAAVQCIILFRYPALSTPVILAICTVIAAAITMLTVIRLTKREELRNTIKTAAALGFAALLIAPAIWSYTPILYGSQTALPYAGPELKAENRANMNGMLSSQLTTFLIENKQNTKYLIAVPDARTAEPIILETGDPVMAIGGFSGNDSILTVEKLKQLIQSGDIRYFLIGGREANNQSDIVNWVKKNGTQVNLDGSIFAGTAVKNMESQGTDSQKAGKINGNVMLYDLNPTKS